MHREGWPFSLGLLNTSRLAVHHASLYHDGLGGFMGVQLAEKPRACAQAREPGSLFACTLQKANICPDMRCAVQVILLFQNIDGVDLCLYCLYMQEYGDDAPLPNRKTREWAGSFLLSEESLLAE